MLTAIEVKAVDPEPSAPLLCVRENMSNVTAEMLMADYQVGGVYLPIKLLAPEDSQKFMECLLTYDQEVIDDVYRHRKIKLQLFIDIMRQINLSNNYRMWKKQSGMYAINLIDSRFGHFQFSRDTTNMSCWDYWCNNPSINLVIDPVTYKIYRPKHVIHSDDEGLYLPNTESLDLNKYIR